jgi:hypothetical protein
MIDWVEFSSDEEEFVNCAEFNYSGEDFKIDWEEFGSGSAEFV